MTIIGYEKTVDNRDCLLVFDPSFRDNSAIRALVGNVVQISEYKAEVLLREYRRDSKYVRKYNEFELL